MHQRSLDNPLTQTQRPSKEKEVGIQEKLERKGHPAAASSETYFETAATTGRHPQHDIARVRTSLRRLAGDAFTKKHEGSLHRWAQQGNDQLLHLWFESDPNSWRGTTQGRKKRAWIFEDLLNGDLAPLRSPPAKDGDLTGSDLLDLDAPLSGNWGRA
jgi:hypothetical protein